MSAVSETSVPSADRTLVAIGAAILTGLLALLLFEIDPHFFLKDDFQLQFLPGSHEVAEAWMSGELPLLNPHSWHASALAAEYQFGVFSLFRALLDIVVWLLPLSLPARAAVLFIAHAMVCAAGASLLARSHGVRPSLAMMVALVASLNGWILWWGTTWIVAVTAFAWLPWYWLGLRSVCHGTSRWSWAGTGIALYLLIAAGSPYVALMAVVMAILHIVPALILQRRAALAMIGSSILGCCLAAPALLPLLEYFPHTYRSVAQPFEQSWFWIVPPAGLFGLVVPAFTTAWPVFAGWLPHPSVELLGGFVALAGLAAGLASAYRRELVRRHTLLLVLIASVGMLMMLPSRTPFQWSFHWLPLFHLGLALLGAIALEKVRRVWIAALGLIFLTALATLLFDPSPAMALAHAALLVALTLLWALLERRELRMARAMPAAITAVMIAATFLAFSGEREVPVWKLEPSVLRAEPFDPARRYLAMYSLADIVLADETGRFTLGVHSGSRPGSLPALAALKFVNGYSSLGPDALTRLFRFEAHGPMPADSAMATIRFESGPQQLLHHMGVDGLIVPVRMAREHGLLLADHGWDVAGSVGAFVLLHRREPTPDPLFFAAMAVKRTTPEESLLSITARRTVPLPVVLFTPNGAPQTERYGRRSFTVARERRNETTVTVSSGPKALIVFRRAWLPGWHATLNGRPLPVLRANMIMPAVEIPPGEAGELRLVYRPASLVAGATLAGIALLVLLVIAIWSSRPHADSQPHGHQS